MSGEIGVSEVVGFENGRSGEARSHHLLLLAVVEQRHCGLVLVTLCGTESKDREGGRERAVLILTVGLTSLGNGHHSARRHTIDIPTFIMIMDMLETEMNMRDSLADVERYRLQLEQNVAKLRASLRHWQTWEFEYETMREELLQFSQVHSSSDLVKDVLVLQI